MVKFDNDVVTCTYDDEVGTDDLIDDNIDTLDQKGKSTLEAKIRSDLTRKSVVRNRKLHALEAAIPNGSSRRTGWRPPHVDWDLCEEYSKLAKLDRDSSSNQKLISVVREMRNSMKKTSAEFPTARLKTTWSETASTSL